MISEATSFFVFYTTSVVLVSDSLYRCTVRGIQLVKDGSFFGIITLVDRSFYSKSSTFHKRYEYISINTAHMKHGFWKYHYGHSSDNGSSSDDEIYYLHPLFKEK